MHVRLTGGGTVLASEGHSVGTIGGDLRWFITIWWDKEATCYRLLTGFRTKTSAGCELRGTAHWEGDRLINDYEEVINGKRTKMQDIWSDITPNFVHVNGSAGVRRRDVDAVCRVAQQA